MAELVEAKTRTWKVCAALRRAQGPPFDPSTGSGQAGSGTTLRQAQGPPARE
ncbi:MAG: hypothetical protein AAGB12_16855 [Pseudomonadota bacterium]